MKTKKYESIMNKAMKAAMNYENPDDQINEFIRFFGEHIGSERIYIFEDNIRKKVTNNTYEWCADGIEPQIKFLQNVDMSIIDWWYTSLMMEEILVLKILRRLRMNILQHMNCSKFRM